VPFHPSRARLVEHSSAVADIFDPRSGGVIAYLTSRFGRNVHDLGVVKISSGSSFSPGGASDPEHAADFASDSWIGTKNEPNSWLCYDFKSRQVIPSRYHVRSYAYGKPSWCNLKNWVLEGSNDSGRWVELDRRENNDVLNDGNALGTFDVQTSVPVQWIRLR
jgi:hypothetical protein